MEDLKAILLIYVKILIFSLLYSLDLILVLDLLNAISLYI